MRECVIGLGIGLVLANCLFGQLQAVNIQLSDPIDAVAIVVTAHGPYPAAFEHSASPVLLAIINGGGGAPTVAGDTTAHDDDQ